VTFDNLNKLLSLVSAMAKERQWANDNVH